MFCSCSMVIFILRNNLRAVLWLACFNLKTRFIKVSYVFDFSKSGHPMGEFACGRLVSYVNYLHAITCCV